jgi:hypothetical protein
MVYSQDNFYDGQASYKGWVNKHSFPYKASNERKERILKNYSVLKVGFSQGQAESLVGKPDFSQASAGKGPGQGYIGSSWTYYFLKPDPNITNLKKDIGIHIFFDTSGNIKWVVPTNVDGLSEIGKPSANNS